MAAYAGRYEETQRNHDESHDRGVHEDIGISKHGGLDPIHLIDMADRNVMDRDACPPHRSQRLLLIEWIYPLRQIALMHLGAFG